MRRSDREVKGTDNILAILDRCEVLRIGMCDGDMPYVVPLNFAWDKSSDDAVSIYLHCASEGRKLDIIARNSNVCFEADCAYRTLTSDTACAWSAEYQSVIGEGTVSVVTDTQSKVAALDLLMKRHGFRGKPEYSPRGLAAVTVLKIDVRSMTGKAKMQPKSDKETVHMQLSKLTGVMIEYFKHLRLAEHSLKVYAYAHGIGGAEGLSDSDMLALCAAAILHDIGIPEAKRLYGSAEGPYQEKEGAIIAPAMLAHAGIEADAARRAVWLIAHHHTLELAQSDALLQILMEADYLVNLAEGRHPELDARDIADNFFKTQTGKSYITSLFLDQLKSD